MDEQTKGACIVAGLILGAGMIADIASPKTASFGMIAAQSVSFALGAVTCVIASAVTSKMLYDKNYKTLATAVMIGGMAATPTVARAAHRLAHEKISQKPSSTVHTTRSAFTDNASLQQLPADTIRHAAALKLVA